MDEGERPGLRHNRWARFDSALARVEGGFLAGLLLVMVFIGFLQVILRNFFQTGIFGADLLLRQGLLWLGLLGASLAVRGMGRHIEIDILSKGVSPLWAGRVRRAADAFAATICALLARASLLFISGEWEAGSLIAGYFPAWIFQSILPIGFTLMAVRFLAAAIMGRPSAAAQKEPAAEKNAAAEEKETP